MPGSRTSSRIGEQFREKFRRFRLRDHGTLSVPERPSSGSSVAVATVDERENPVPSESIGEASARSTASEEPPPASRPLTAGATTNGGAHSQSSNAHDIALGQLSDAEREKLRVCVENRISAARVDNAQFGIQDLIASCEQLQRQSPHTTKSLRIGNRNIDIEGVVTKSIRCLDVFKNVGDVIANADPVHIGLPWAGVRLLLQVAISSMDSGAVALLDHLNEVVRVLSLCTIHDRLCLGTPGAGGSRNDAVDGLRSAIIRLYVSSFRFIITILELLDKSNFARAMASTFAGVNFADQKQTICGLANEVETRAQRCRQNLRTEENRRLKDLLDQTRAIIDRIDGKMAVVWKSVTEQDREKVLRWVSEVAHEADHKSVTNSRTPRTCRWILERAEYTQWQDTETQSTFLWLYGIPGAGKTTLLSKVVDHFGGKDLEEQPRASQVRSSSPGDNQTSSEQPSSLSPLRARHYRLAFFYCQRHNSSHNRYEYVLRSFVKQLSVSEDGTLLHEPLDHLYSERRIKGFASSDPTVEECLDLLSQLIESSPTVLIVDALDELPESHRERLLQDLNDLLSKSKTLKVLLSSRPADLDIQTSLSKRPKIGIQETDNDVDIQAYVLDTINQSQEKRRHKLTPALRTEITQTLTRESKGMFQWTVLQVKQIMVMKREVDIRQRLGRLPKTLKDAYDEIYGWIQEESGSLPAIAERSFQWMMYAPSTGDYATPHGAAMVAAVCKDPDSTSGWDPNDDADLVVACCKNLLVYDADRGGKFAFPHLSVLEYLEDRLRVGRSSWNSTAGRELVTKVHLKALSELGQVTSTLGLNDNAGLKDHQEKADLALYDHAFHTWVDHLRGCDIPFQDDRLGEKLVQFLGLHENSTSHYHEWASSMYGSRLSRRFQPTSHVQKHLLLAQSYSEKETEKLNQFPVRQAICLFGIYDFLPVGSQQDFVLSIADEPFEDRRNLSDLLLFSILGGSLALVQRLLQIDRESNDSSVEGDGEKVPLVNQPCHFGYGTPFLAACYHSSFAMFRVLLDHGANPNELKVLKSPPNPNSDEDYKIGSPLIAAVRSPCDSQLKVGRMLDPDVGCDVNIVAEGDFAHALTAACWEASPERALSAARQLLARGALPDAARSTFPQSALVAAAAKGHDLVIDLLVSHGANVNSILPGRYGSPLAALARFSHADAVRLLIAKGADANAVLATGTCGSALAAVAMCTPGGDKTDILEALVEAGADVGMEFDGEHCFHRTALGAARHYGNSSVLRFLDARTDI